MRPLIGLTCEQEFNANGRDRLLAPRDYFRAVEKAGGVPLLLPYLPEPDDALEVLQRLDGLLITGGVDVDPAHFGELPIPQLGAIEPERDAAEITYVHLVLRYQIPMLCICRGIQILAAATGGSLYQDINAQIPGSLKHAQPHVPPAYGFHGVRIVPGSRLAGLLGAGEVKVNSRHHQAVKAVPQGFVVSATAPDGVIEGLEAPDHPFAVGVQWHPENFASQYNTFDGLFSGLVEAARTYRTGKLAAGAHP